MTDVTLHADCLVPGSAAVTPQQGDEYGTIFTVPSVTGSFLYHLLFIAFFCSLTYRFSHD